MGQSVTDNTRIGKERIYLFLLYGSFIIEAIGWLIYVMAFHSYFSPTESYDGTEFVGGILVILGAIGCCAALIYSWVLFYQIWRFVIYELRHDNLTPSIDTPDKAIGYFFIPFYNFYWAFKAFGKLPADINALARGRGIRRTVTEELGMTISVLVLFSVIPYFGYVTLFVNLFILFPIFICKSVSLCRYIREESLTQTQINQV